MKYKFLTISLPVLLFIIFSFYLTSKFIEPAPKKELIIATGQKDGTYYKTALIYKKLLEKENVKITLLQTQGSVENFELLLSKKADIAFLQNGIIPKSTPLTQKSLANIYYEPLWVFYKNNNYQMEYLVELISKRIAIGVEGSGTNDLATKILLNNGINSSNSNLQNISSKKGKESLLKGDIDALFMVSNHKNSIVKELLENPNINILNVKRAQAYSRTYNSMEVLSLYEGTIDLYRNIPSNDIKLLSTTATLVVNDDVPSELIRLLLKNIKEVHNGKNFFSSVNEFPNINNLNIDIHEEAIKYFNYGDNFLEKIFPYWIASNIDRLKILLIPLLTLLFPLFKGFFPLYTWTMRSKIFKWYKELRELETQLDNLNKEQLKDKLLYLENLKKEIHKVTKVPLSFMGEYYNLGLHIELMIQRLRKRVEEL